MPRLPKGARFLRVRAPAPRARPQRSARAAADPRRAAPRHAGLGSPRVRAPPPAYRRSPEPRPGLLQLLGKRRLLRRGCSGKLCARLGPTEKVAAARRLWIIVLTTENGKLMPSESEDPFCL